MKSEMRCLLGIIFILGCSGAFSQAVHAQGVYTSEDEGVGDIETDLSGYDGTGCPNTASIYSDLNGVSVNGALGYNNIIQYVEATPDVTYIWNWGFTVYFTNPYTGYCDSYQESFSWGLKLTTTFYGDPYVQGDTCNYTTLACETGTPTCSTITFCPGFTFEDPCPEFMVGDWLVVNGTCEFCLGSGSDVPGSCT
jgi:hypothetical protein